MNTTPNSTKLTTYLHLAALLGFLLTPGTSLSTPISCGQTITGTISAAGQADSYTFSGTAGDKVVISACASSGGLSAVAELYDPTGTLVGGAEQGNSGSLTLLKTGTYTIMVHDHYYSDTGGYGVCLSFATGRCGTAISCGQTLTGTISTAGQANSYTFIGTAGEAVVLSACASSGGLSAVAELYDPTGTLVGGAEQGNSGSLTLLKTGTYTIMVHDHYYSDTGGYGVCLSFATGRCGTAISCGQTLTNSISTAGQANSYTFIGTPGEMVIFNTYAYTGSLASYADLYGPTGAFIGSAYQGSSGVLSLPMTGIYTILVHDHYYSDSGSFGISLTVLGGCAALPTVSVTPATQVVAIGSSATFTANASGPAPLFYQWRFGSKVIAGATNTTYSIAQVQATNAGGYVVVVSNPGGAVTSSPPAQLTIGTVSILPAIPNTNINELVLWQYTPAVIGSGYTFGLSNAPTSMTVNSSSGTISWTPTEAQGPSTNANITYAVYQAGSTVAWTNFTVVVNEVNVAPVLYVPGLQTVYATTTLTVTNYATDSDIPANTLTFAIVSGPSGVVINPTTGVLTWTPNSGQVGTNVITLRVTDYNPWAVNSQQLSSTDSFSVVVKGLTAPSFTQQPISQVVNAGQSVTFTAGATGYPTPTYQWRFNGVNISGATGSSLNIPVASLTNIGWYDVVIANSVSTNYSASVSLGFIDLKMLAGIYVTGAIGGTYRIDATSALAPTNWTTLTNVTITTQPYIYVDYSSPTNSRQFYRAVPQ